MEFVKVHGNKKKYMALLLLADESEKRIDEYLDRGTMFAILEEDGVRAVCVVTEEADQTLEIQNLAATPAYQRKGYGRAMVRYLVAYAAGKYDRITVGTGDSPLTVPFYEACGFKRSYVIPDFYPNNYDHPIFEGGHQLIDKIYFEMILTEAETGR